MFFSKSENWKYSVKNQRTMTKFELNLYFLVTYLHMQFQLHTYILTKVRERKLKFYDFFLSSRGITLSKIIGPWPNSNSTCIFPWRIYMPNVSSISATVNKIMNGNLNDDGMTETRNDGNTVTLYAPGHFMAGAWK